MDGLRIVNKLAMVGLMKVIFEQRLEGDKELTLKIPAKRFSR